MVLACGEGGEGYAEVVLSVDVVVGPDQEELVIADVPREVIRSGVEVVERLVCTSHALDHAREACGAVVLEPRIWVGDIAACELVAAIEGPVGGVVGGTCCTVECWIVCASAASGAPDKVRRATEISPRLR